MLKVENLYKKYGKKTVISDVSLQVKPGQAFGLLGINGAGKTTTMKITVGLIQPDIGNILIDGQLLTRQARSKIGFMPEGPYFYENLSGLEFISFCGGLFSNEFAGKEHCRAILERVGLADAVDKRIRMYSKGMRQRLGFAQATINNPGYIFLDEPLDGLDPIGRREIKEMLISMKQEGKAVFLNSHILSDIEEICDTIGIIHEGKIVYTGPTREFCDGKPLEQQFVKLITNIK